MSTDNEKLNSKDLTSKIENENSICEKICKFFTVMSYAILVLLLIFLSLVLFYSIVFIIFDKTKSTESAEGVGIILASFISIIGVFFGFKFNRKQTYNEIVTRERIEWLHKMQEALAEFLALTSKNDLLSGDKDKLDKARKLYYLIISNLNVKEDKEKKNKNEREAVESLYEYARSRGLDVELNFNRNLDSEENKDSNKSISFEDLKKANEDLKDKIKTLEDKIKNLRKTEEVDPLAGLKRKEIIRKYTEIFNETWNRIKNEAD